MIANLLKITTGLLVVSLFLMMLAGHSYRMRRSRSPRLYFAWLLVLAVCDLVSLVTLLEALRSNIGAMVSMMLFVFSCLLTLAALGPGVLHRISGYRPTLLNVRMQMSGSGAREKILNRLRTQLEVMGFHETDPTPWGCDQVMTQKRGILTEWENVIMVFTTIQPIHNDLRVSILVDYMDIALPYINQNASQRVFNIALDIEEIFSRPPLSAHVIVQNLDRHEEVVV